MRRDLTAGFSMIELMVTIAIVAILIAVAFPSFEGSMRSNRVTTATNEIVTALSLARSEAVKNTRGSGICVSTDGATCTGGTDWSVGWLVWEDANGNGTLNTGEPILRVNQQSARLVVSSPQSAITFDSRGRRRSNTNIVLTVRPDDCGGQPLQRTLTINATGNVSTAKGACP